MLERSKKIFVGTLQSEWYGSRKPFKQHFSALERRWLRRFCSLIIARDKKTSDYLESKGLVYAISFGNPMMDCLIIKKEKLFPKDKAVIGILPGSKRETYDNFGNIIETIKELARISGKKSNYFFTVAFSPNLDIVTLIDRFGLIKVEGVKSPTSFSAYNISDSDISLFISNSSFGNIISDYSSRGEELSLFASGEGKLNPSRIEVTQFKEGVTALNLTYNKAQEITLTCKEEGGEAEGTSSSPFPPRLKPGAKSSPLKRATVHPGFSFPQDHCLLVQ